MSKNIIVISQKGNEKTEKMRCVVADDVLCYFIKKNLTTCQAAIDAYRIYKNKVEILNGCCTKYSSNKVWDVTDYSVSPVGCLDKFKLLLGNNFVEDNENLLYSYTNDLLIVLPKQEKDMSEILSWAWSNLKNHFGNESLKESPKVILLNITKDEEFETDKIIKFVNSEESH